MASETRTLRTSIPLEELQRLLAAHFDSSIARVRVTAGAEGAVGADIVRFTLQVVDRPGKEWGPAAGRWLLFVYLSATPHGAPSATGNTVAWSTGTVLETVLPNGAYRVITNSQGVAVMDVTIAGAATRYPHTHVLGLFEPGSAGTWT